MRHEPEKDTPETDMNNTPTPRTDEWLAEEKRNPRISGLGNWLDYCKTLERELTAVTEQRDDFKKELEIANLRLKGKRHPDDNGIMAEGEIDVKAVTEQRDAASAEFYRYHGLWDRSTKQLETVMYQRDRLAEELTTTRQAHDVVVLAFRKVDAKLTAVTEQRDALVEAMGEIAYQKVSDELDDYTYEHANWEGSWDYIINTARKTLQSLNQDHTVDANDMIAAVKGGADEISR